MKFRFPSLLVFIFCCLTTPVFALLGGGDAALDFSGENLEEQRVSLSDFKGEFLLIEMGTTWCPSCNELAHHIDKIRPLLKKKGVTFISVYLADTADSIKAHLSEEKLAPADRTMLDDDGEARQNYNVFTIPRLLLIDKNFKIIFDEMMLDEKELKSRINSIQNAH
jgi:thiol-disulfide isomerase/thioredoxin